MADKVIILGGGPAGYVAAIRAAQLGGEVSVVEKDRLGGTCLNRGCIPTKALLASVEVLSSSRQGEKFGLKVGDVSPDFPAMLSRKDKIVEQLVKGVEFLFKSRKINLLKGEGKFLEPKVVEVTKEDGSKERLEGDKIIIATGSEPAKPSLFSFDGERIITSNEALNLSKIPESLLIVGAGAIGVEFASIFRELGTEVTIVEMLPQILPTEDEEVVQILEREFKKKRIKVHTGTKIEKVESLESKVASKLSSGETIESEKVLVAVGRKLNSEGLDRIGLKIEKGKVLVNERMETNIPDLYVAGDVTGGVLLAHKASAEGIVAAENALGKTSTMDYKVIPSCIFSHPEVASVGLSEKKAKEEGARIKVGKFPFRALGKAQALGRFEGLVKIVADAESDEILGVHIIGPQATDLIAEGALALRMEATVEDLARTIHAHPTLSEAMMEAAHALHNRAIHLP
jgi:dihydrolipoamide dehydrogenase